MFSLTLDILGEHTKTLNEAENITNQYQSLLKTIKDHKIDANISIKPTHIGNDLGRDIFQRNLLKIVRTADQYLNFVRIDMEDSKTTEDTISTYKEAAKNHKNIGIVFQAYLFRTFNDIEQISDKRLNFRLCKGIYLEPSEISHTSYQSIVDSFCSDIDLALDLDAYVGIASHDLKIINYAQEVLKSRNLGPGLDDGRANSPKNRVGKGQGYEFQFLLGVRGNIRRKLASEGHLTRVYIPYGGQWYEYSMRRLRENPDIAWHVFKAMIFPWSNRR